MGYRVVDPAQIDWITRPHGSGEPPERGDIAVGERICVDPGAPLQAVNHGDVDLLVYAIGHPPESRTADFLDPVV